MKGFRSACEVGFCRFDEDSMVVWVVEMARYQIAGQPEAKDNRCKGIQRAYDGLPENPYLEPFFEKYGAAFHMTSKRSSDRPEVRNRSRNGNKILLRRRLYILLCANRGVWPGSG